MSLSLRAEGRIFLRVVNFLRGAKVAPPGPVANNATRTGHPGFSVSERTFFSGFYFSGFFLESRPRILLAKSSENPKVVLALE